MINWFKQKLHFTTNLINSKLTRNLSIGVPTVLKEFQIEKSLKLPKSSKSS